MKSNPADAWVFGYGSLIWRPDFPYQQCVPGHIDGWVRRFWQGSHDHRGVPDAPGRVVTLVPEAGASCGGMAYCIDHSQIKQVVDQLDYREKNGYERLDAECQLVSGEVIQCITYIAGPANEAYLGEAPNDVIAAQIATAHGPSGSNRDYLLQLASALRALQIEDQHVFALERLV